MASAAEFKAPMCNSKLFGGPDAFPWSIAQPFPWDIIQGLWEFNEESNESVIRMKIIRESSTEKLLSVAVISKYSCTRVMKGTGIITASEKNIVRIKLNDVNGGTKLMKLGFFDTAMLNINTELCGKNILAASMIDLDSIPNYQTKSEQIEINVLKKVSDDLFFNCKKQN